MALRTKQQLPSAERVWDRMLTRVEYWAVSVAGAMLVLLLVVYSGRPDLPHADRIIGALYPAMLIAVVLSWAYARFQD